MTEAQNLDADAAPCRPWTLTLEVAHLDGPPFDLGQHSEGIETEIIRRLADVVVQLGSRTIVRIETHMRRTDHQQPLPRHKAPAEYGDVTAFC